MSWQVRKKIQKSRVSGSFSFASDGGPIPIADVPNYLIVVVAVDALVAVTVETAVTVCDCVDVTVDILVFTPVIVAICACSAASWAW